MTVSVVVCDILDDILVDYRDKLFFPFLLVYVI